MNFKAVTTKYYFNPDAYDFFLLLTKLIRFIQPFRREGLTNRSETFRAVVIFSSF